MGQYISNEDIINTHSDWDAARADKEFSQINDNFAKFNFIVKGFRREFDKAQEADAQATAAATAPPATNNNQQQRTKIDHRKPERLKEETDLKNFLRWKLGPTMPHW